MNVRRIIVSIISITYIILFVKKVEITQGLFIVLMGTILVNQAVEEYKVYLETKNRSHLVIPIASLIIIIFTVLNLIK